MSHDGPYRQDPDCSPSMPVAPIVDVILTYNNRSRHCEALIDSGSPISTIPSRIVQQLQPKKMGSDPIGGATDNQPRQRFFYFVDVAVAGVVYTSHPLYDLETTHKAMIIGRDILNNHRTLLDGPDETLSIG